MVDNFLGEWEAFRRDREEKLSAPHGFLSITGLHWLDTTPQRCDGAPGTWWLGPDGVHVELAGGESLTIDGRAVTGHQVLGRVAEAGLRAHAGDVVVEVAGRGDAVMLRPRDPSSALLARYERTPTYPPSPDWAIRATFHPLEVERIDEVVGQVAFEIHGQPARLVAYEDNGGLWLVFSDATAGRTTYAAGRQLYAPAPDADGTVVVDFNRTINLPCAYTDFTTCPVPIPQNRLPFPVEAGEQNPVLVAAAHE